MEVKIKDEWKRVEYTDSWLNLVKKHGWKFCYLTQDNTVMMERDGYINEFRNDSTITKYNINVENFVEVLQETLEYAKSLQKFGFSDCEKELIFDLCKIIVNGDKK